MAIVALSDTTEAKRYNGISKDCRNVKWTMTSYAGKNCTGRKTVRKHTGPMPKCVKLNERGIRSLNWKCNSKEMEMAFYRGKKCTGPQARGIKGGYFKSWKFAYDKCINYDNPMNANNPKYIVSSKRIHPEGV